MLRLSSAILLAVLISFALAGCSGSDDSNADTPSGGSSSSQDDSSDTAGSEANDDSDDTESAAEDPVVQLTRDLIEGSLDAGAPPQGGAELVGDAPNYRAAAAFQAILESEVGVLPGIELFVFPIAGTGNSLLVFDADATAAAGSEQQEVDFAPALTAILDSDEAAEAGISRIAVNFTSVDEEGPVVITMTMTVDIARKMLADTLTDEEAATALLIGISRPTP